MPANPSVRVASPANINRPPAKGVLGYLFDRALRLAVRLLLRNYDAAI